MNTAETYEKMYFSDNYKEQYEAMRAHYRARTREALQSRKVDHAPVPNATTIVFLHDGPDAGTTVTSTGDFVAYFNRRFGGSDRIGAARRSLANAARKAETCRDMDKKRVAAMKKSEEKSFIPARTARSGFSLLRAVLALMLILAVGVWGGSTLVLDQTEDYVLELEEEIAVLDAGAEMTLSEDATTSSESSEISTYMSIGGEDLVEVYPAEGVEMSGLLSIFARLFQ